jgi:tetratricopeptide (TPR) repeat protein
VSATTLKDFLIALRRQQQSLSPAVAVQVLCAAIRAAESQDVAAVAGAFLLDEEDGLVLDLAVAPADDPPSSGAELARALLTGAIGVSGNPFAAVVQRGLDGGFPNAAALREALEAISPPLAPRVQQRLYSGLRELYEAWRRGESGASIARLLDSLAVASSRPPPALSAPPPPPPSESPLEPRIVGLESIIAAQTDELARMQRRGWRVMVLPALVGGASSAAIVLALVLGLRGPERRAPAPKAPEIPTLNLPVAPPPEPKTPPAPAAETSPPQPALVIPPTAPATPPPAIAEASPPPAAKPPPLAADTVELERPRAPKTPSRPAAAPRTPSARSGAQTKVDAGELALRKGNPDQAAVAFQAALKIDPTYAPAVRGLATAHMAQGKETEAKREYERYLELAPTAPDAARIRKVAANLGTPQ